MDASGRLPFAVLRAINRDAQDHLDRAIDYMNGSRDDYHLSFVEGISWQTTVAMNRARSSHTSSGVSSHAPTRHPDAAFMLSYTQLPEAPKKGWRFGVGSDQVDAGSREVDFLASDPRKQSSRDFGDIHFVFKVHPLSGMLVLTANLSFAPISYYSAGNWVQIGRGSPWKSHVMYQKQNRIRVGRSLEYELCYQMPDSSDARKDLVSERSNFVLKTLRLPNPLVSQWPLVPRPATTILGRDGTLRIFGFENLFIDDSSTVFRAIDHVGQPLMVRRMMHAGGTARRARVRQELQIYRSNKPNSGVLEMKDSWCEHNLITNGHLEPCFHTMDIIHASFLMPLANFQGYPFHLAGPRKVKEIFRCTLQGLEDLHSRNIIHRDIRQENMVIMHEQKPFGAIIGLGKAKIGFYDTSTDFPAPECTAPEAFPENADIYKPGGYNNSLDVFSWGFAIAKSLGYTPKNTYTYINRDIHDDLEAFLTDMKRNNREYSALANCLLLATSWWPSVRPTAHIAGYMPCWYDFPTAKRKVDDVSRSSNSSSNGKKPRPGN